MFDLIWRDFTVEVADAILIGSLVQLGVGGLVGFSHFALSEDFFLAVASTDVNRVEFGHRRTLSLKYLTCRESRRDRAERNWLLAEVLHAVR